VFQSLKHNILKTKKVECKGLDGEELALNTLGNLQLRATP